MKEDIGRARRVHPGYEPSFPPDPIVIPGPPRAPLPTLDEPRPKASKPPGFGSIFASMGNAAERMTKRVTVLLAIVSAIGIVAAVALTYWMAEVRRYVTEDRVDQQYKALREDIRLLRLDIESEALTRKGMQDDNRRIQDELFQHTQALAQLTPPGKRKGAR